VTIRWPSEKDESGAPLFAQILATEASASSDSDITRSGVST